MRSHPVPKSSILVGAALFLGIVGGAAFLAPESSIPVLAASNCSTGGPGMYTITLCITSPQNNATLVDAVPVTATVSIVGSTPGIQRLVYTLGSQYLLSDFSASPYTFDLPSDKFVDGTYSLFVQALANDGFATPQAGISVTLANGITTPPTTTAHFTPTTGTTASPGQPFVVAAVGDGAGGETPEANVVNLISSWNPNLFLYLGDVYEQGSSTEFYNWYAPSTFFGRFRSITNPTVGNHEYLMGLPQPTGYYDYWGVVADDYAFNAGGWHFINLNSECSNAGGCNAGSPQYVWLQNDLSANTSACTLAFYHEPLFDVGPEATPPPAISGLWSLLAANGVDVVLNGHDHNYQRWVPLDGSGNPAAAGITEFIAAAGGHGVQAFVTTDSRLAFGVDTAPTAYGALRLELYSNGLVYRYINTAGTTLDTGSILCSGATGLVPPGSIYLPFIAR